LFSKSPGATEFSRVFTMMNREVVDMTYDPKRELLYMVSP
jgi:hypothetical protein